MATNMSLRGILDKENFLKDGASYPEWERRIKLILAQDGKLYIMDALVAPINQPGPNANPVDVIVWEQRVKDERDVKYLMLAAMSSDLSEQHKGMTAREIYVNLQGMFKKSDRKESDVRFNSV